MPLSTAPAGSPPNRRWAERIQATWPPEWGGAQRHKTSAIFLGPGTRSEGLNVTEPARHRPYGSRGMRDEAAVPLPAGDRPVDIRGVCLLGEARPPSPPPHGVGPP
jgi:hypothetical protein